MGLAQAHVVGEAGAQAEAREKPEPADPDLLVGSERGPERRARVGRGQRLGPAQALERRREPLPRHHPGPLVPPLRRCRRLAVGQRRPGQEAHRLPEGEPLAGGAARRLPVGEDLAELFLVQLHPLPSHEGEPVRAGEDLSPLRVREGLPFERDGDREVEERVQSEGGGRLAPNGDADLKPPGAIRPPPVGHPDHDAGRFEGRHVLEEAVRLAGRPGQRLEDVSRVHQVLEHGAGRGGAIDRSEQGQQRRPVPGERPERLAEGLMLRPGLAGEAGRVGREEAEGMVAVVLVLRQVKVDSPDEVPDGVLGLQVGLDAPPMVADLLAEERLELRPPGLEPGHIHVLAPGERRRLSGEPVELPERGRNVHLGAPLLDVAEAAEPGDEEPREVPEESQRRRKPGRDLDGTEVKEPGGWPADEGGRDRRGRPRIER
jgi:hypothetical protein